MIIDTHQHLWDPAARGHPGLSDAPAINRACLSGDYRRAAEGCGITGTVFMEGAAGEDATGSEAAWALALAERRENRIAGVVASVWPEREDFAERLAAIAGHPKLKGLRRVLHTEPDALSRSARFRENVKRLGPLGLTFDLCVLERQLPLAIELVDACPEVSFVLDHCGVPAIAARDPSFWTAQISRLAERANVTCKVSGLLVYAAEDQRSAEGLRPWFEPVVAAFGWNRLVWGSDWPVCTLAVPLARWVEVTHGLLDAVQATPAQRAGLLHRNATRIYRLNP